MSDKKDKELLTISPEELDNTIEKALTKQREIFEKEKSQIVENALKEKDKEEKKTTAQIEVNEAKHVYKNLGEQLMDVYHADKFADARKRLDRAELSPEAIRRKAPSGMGEAIPSDGGYLLQNQFAVDLNKSAFDSGVLAPRCTNITIGDNSNGLTVTYIDERSRIDGQRWGGVRVYRMNEGDQSTASKPKLRQETIRLEKMIATVNVTDEMLNDSTQLQSVIMTAYPDEFNFKLQNEIVNGTGAGECLGLTKSNALVTVAKETSPAQGADTVVRENIKKVWNRMPISNRMNSVWLINQDVEPELEDLVLTIGTGGVYASMFPAYMPAGTLTNNTPYATLAGRPVLPIEQCPALGDVGDILLVDLSQYVLITKDAIQASSSTHVRFDYDETMYKFTYRINGQPKWHSPVTAYKGATERSPIIALAAR